MPSAQLSCIMRNMLKSKNTVYVKTTLNTAISVRAIYTIHYFKYGQQFSFEGEKHDFWEMVYIDSGKAHIRADEREFELSQGEAYFHKPGEYHTILTDDNFANSVIITFECHSPAIKAFENAHVTLSDAQRRVLAGIVTESRECFIDKFDDVYMAKLTKSNERPFGAEQLIRVGLEQLLIMLYRSLGSVAAPVKNSPTAGELTDRIKAILKDNVGGEISLDELSQMLYFSKTHLKATFKKHTGMTIMQYFTLLKTEEAKRLISLDKYTFTEIAYRLGYSTLHYFSRQFKKETDMTPGEYARSIRVDNLL